MSEKRSTRRKRPDQLSGTKISDGKPTKPRVSKAQWLEAGLQALEMGGVQAVRVEALAKNLTISKSGFYWHFRDRQHLLNEVRDYWQHEFTDVAAYSPMIHDASPLRRIKILLTKIHEHDLTRYDLAFLAWAENDENVRRTVENVMRTRLDTLRAAFSDLGYTGADLEMRAQTFVTQQSFGRFLFPQRSQDVEDAQSEAFLNMMVGSTDQP